MDHSAFRPHRIEFHILFVVTGGRGSHMVDFVDYPVRRGSLVWIAPGQIHHFDGSGGLGGYLVLFQPEVCGIKAPRLLWPKALEPPDGDFELLETLTELTFGLRERELSSRHDRLAWRLLSVILEVWEGAVDHSRAQGEHFSSPEFEAFESLLEENFAQHRDVSWYARHLGYAEKTLSRWCRRAVGASAKSHIDRRVALEAKRLLVHTDQTIDAISAELGFSEPTNFVKFFKRVESGTTPSGFRDAYS